MNFFVILFIILKSQTILCNSFTIFKPVITKKNNHIGKIKSEQSHHESGIIPKKYNIQFHLNKNFTFVGKVEIQAQVITNNNQIILDHSSNSVINSLSITNNKKVVKISSSNYNKKKEQFNIYLTDTLPAGTSITINISYVGDVLKHIKNLETFSYWNKDHLLKKITTLHYKLSSAKEVVPCINCDQKDGPKANISITIWRPDVFIHPKYFSKHRSTIDDNYTHYMEIYNSPEPRTIDFITYLITDIGQPSISKWVQRYNYKQWLPTIKCLREKDYIKIDEINRASIIDHLFNSAKAKSIGYSISLLAAQYLIQERNYLPWKIAFKHFEDLNKILIHSESKHMWQRYLFTVFNEIYYELGFTEGVDDSNEKKILRSDIIKWTCGLSHFDCISRSSQIFHSWKLNDSIPIPVILQQTIFCTAIKWGTEDDWNFLWAKYLETNITTQKNIIMNALSCTEDPEKINKLLSNVVTKGSEFQFKGISNVLASGYFSRPEKSKTNFDFIQHYNQQISDHYKDDSQLVRINSSRMNKDNFEWFKGSYPEIYAWLSSKYPNKDKHLPSNMKPLQYDIRIIPYLEENNFTFDGSVSIILNVLNYTSCIVLHSNDLIISRISAYDVNSSIPYAISKYSNEPYNKLSIYLDTIIRPGLQLVLDIEYSGLIKEKMEGLFRNSYKDENGTTHWIAATQFEKLDARRVFPCFDEPALKAFFKISIMRPNHYQTLSNMELQYSVASAVSNWTWDHYKKSILMSTYLVAFVIFDYKYKSSLNSNFSLWSYKNSTDANNHALQLAQKSLDFLEEYTGLRYPMKKLDFIIIPNFHIGGMENWGLITLNDLVPVSTTPSFFTMFSESIITHEVAHMWFGNLATCDSWEYLWLNEGFATYFQWLIMESIKPEWKWIDTFIYYDMIHALEKDSAIDSKPMNDKHRNYVDFNYDIKETIILYEKSACIIRMMEHAFGAEVFHSAVKYYLQENQFKTVTPSKLWAALDRKIHEAGGIPEVNQSVSILMESWTSQPGYPVVHVKRVSGNLSLTQERFFTTKRNESSTPLYWIPISIASKSNLNFSNTSPTLWMRSRELHTSLSMDDDEWFIFNVQQTGFYRVNYDVITWKNLFKALNQDNFGGIPEIHRTQIIDDLFNLAKGGYISYDLVLTGTKYLLNEKSESPWRAFKLGFINLFEELTNENTEIDSENHFKELILFNRNRTTTEELLNNEQLDKMKEKLLYFWSCRTNIEYCIYQEKNKK